MPWEPERNRYSLSPHHLKAAEGFATRSVHDINSVPCPDMPPGLTSMVPLNANPHGAGPQMNFQNTPSAARPVGEPTEIRPPHNPAPHHYGGDPKEPNTYGLSRVPRR
jgi:hypothetical protein